MCGTELTHVVPTTPLRDVALCFACPNCQDARTIYRNQTQSPVTSAIKSKE
jgi:hypothetical protein